METQVVTYLCIQLSRSQPVFLLMLSCDLDITLIRFWFPENGSHILSICQAHRPLTAVEMSSTLRKRWLNQRVQRGNVKLMMLHTTLWNSTKIKSSGKVENLLRHITKWEQNVRENRNCHQITCHVSDVSSLLLTWFLYDFIICTKFK